MPGTVRTQARSTRTAAPRTGTIRAPTATRIAAKTGVLPGWIWPVSGTRITSRFESGHQAVDIGIPVGTPLYAPHAGTIAKVGWDTSGYGEHIVLNTLDGLQIYLGHLSEVNVSVGDNVAPGQQIGRTGNTGNSTGPHLHYEIRQGSGRVDPLSLEYGQVDKTIKATATPKPVSRLQANALAPKQAYAAEIPEDSKKGNLITNNPFYKAGKTVGTGIVTGTVADIPGTTVQAFKDTLNEELFSKIKWGNWIAGTIGFVLLGIGAWGLVSSEAIKQAIQPVIQAVKETGGGE